MKKFIRSVHHFWNNIQKEDYQSPKRRIDLPFLIAVILLSLFGIIMVYNTSVPISLRIAGDPNYFIRDQIVWFILGMGVLFACSLVPFRYWYSAAVPFLLGTLILLVAVFFPGIGIRVLGANRWINLGFTTLQPSEFAKLAVSIYLSAWLSIKEKGRFGAFVLFLGCVVGLVVLQPDVGTSIILMCISLSLYVISGAPLKQLVAFIPILLVAFLLLAVVAPYRLARLTTFLNPDSDPQGASYQIRQALIAIGSGGITGVGLGQSRQKQEYLPEANTDAIFAIIGEELGFVGTTSVIILLTFIIWRGFLIARHAPTTFGRLLASGIMSWFGFQSAINLGAIVSLFPLTGVPLPLVSYGGSSFIVLSAALGIMLNISRYKKI